MLAHAAASKPRLQVTPQSSQPHPFANPSVKYFVIADGTSTGVIFHPDPARHGTLELLGKVWQLPGPTGIGVHPGPLGQNLRNSVSINHEWVDYTIRQTRVLLPTGAASVRPARRCRLLDASITSQKGDAAALYQNNNTII